MVYQALALLLVALALTLFAGAPAPAGEKGKDDGINKEKADGLEKAPRRHRHEGTVVSVTADKLVMKRKARDGEESKEHTHTLAAKAKVTCDGKVCKLEDLKPGQRVRVTTSEGDRTIAIRVEALDKNERFQKREGKEAETKDSAKSPR